MRTLLLIGLTGLALAGTEARAGGAHLGSGPVRPAATAPDLAARGGGAARPTYVVLPGEPAADAPRTLPKPVAAGPWCRSGRVVGTGAGFCMVN